MPSPADVQLRRERLLEVDHVQVRVLLLVHVDRRRVDEDAAGVLLDEVLGRPALRHLLEGAGL